jgi:Tfp pilus assembly protein PilE
MKHASQSLGAGRARQRGISLVEMGIVVAVVAILSVGAFMAFQKVRMDSYMDKARKEIPLTINAINASMMTQTGSTSAVNTAYVSMFNAWPKDRVTDAGKATVAVKGPFPGSTEQVFGFKGTAAPRVLVGWRAFNYWIVGVPPEACMSLLQMLAAHGSVANVSIGVEGGNAPAGDTYAAEDSKNPFSLTAGKDGVLAINPTNAKTGCTSGGAGKKLTFSVVVVREG